MTGDREGTCVQLSSTAAALQTRRWTVGTTSPLEAPRSVHPLASVHAPKGLRGNCTLSSHRTAATEAPEVPPRSSGRGRALIPSAHWLHALGPASGIVGNVVPTAPPATEAGSHPEIAESRRLCQSPVARMAVSMWAGMEALPETVRVRGQRRFDLTSGPPMRIRVV